MIRIEGTEINPSEHEAEAASSSYLMSLVVVLVGIPLPVINLIATIMFFIGNRKKTLFVRWHSMQALLSQLFLFFMNSYGFWWTIAIIFTSKEITNNYIAYILTIFMVNVVELVATIYAALETRKARHVRMPIFAEFTDQIIKR